MSGFSSFFINPFSRSTTTTRVSQHNHNSSHSRYFSSSSTSTIDSSTTLGSSVSDSDEDSIRDTRLRGGQRRRGASISSSGSSGSEDFSSESEEEVEQARERPQARPRTSPATMSASYSQQRPRGLQLNPVTPSRPLTATITTQQLPKPTLINRDTATPTTSSNDNDNKRPYTPARVSLAKFFYGKLGGVAPTSPPRAGVPSVSSSGCTTPRNIASRNGPPPAPPVTTAAPTTAIPDTRDVQTPTTALPLSRGISTPNEASERAHREWMARERHRQEQLRVTALQTRLLLEEELKREGFGAPVDEFVVVGRDVKIGSGRYKNGRGKRGGIDVNGNGRTPRRSGLEPEEGALLIEEDLTIPDDRSSEGPYAAVRGWVVDTEGHYGENLPVHGREGSGSSQAETLFHPQAPSAINSPQLESSSPPSQTTQPPTTNLPDSLPQKPEELFRALPVTQEGDAFNLDGNHGLTPVSLPFPVQMPVYTGLGLAELPADLPTRQFSVDKGKAKDTEPVEVSGAPAEKLKDWQLVERVPLPGTPPPQQETYPPLPPSTATSTTSSGPVRVPTQPIVGNLVRRTTTADSEIRKPLKRTPTFKAAVVAVVEPDVERLVVEVQAIEVPEEQAKNTGIDPDYYKDSDDEGENGEAKNDVFVPPPLVVRKTMVEEVKGVNVVQVSPEEEEDELKFTDARRGSRAPTTVGEEAPAVAATVIPVSVKEEKEDEVVPAPAAVEKSVEPAVEVEVKKEAPAAAVEIKKEEPVAEVVKKEEEVPKAAVDIAPTPAGEPAVVAEKVVEVVKVTLPVVAVAEGKGKQKEVEEEVKAVVDLPEVTSPAAVVEKTEKQVPTVDDIKNAATPVAPKVEPIAPVEPVEVKPAVAEITKPIEAVIPIAEVEKAPEVLPEPTTARSVTPPPVLPQVLPPRLNTPAVGGFDSWDNLVNDILRDRDDEGQVAENPRLQVVQEVPLSPVLAPAKPHPEERHLEEEEVVKILPVEGSPALPTEEVITPAAFAELQHQIQQLQQQHQQAHAQPAYVKPAPPPVPFIPRNLSDEEKSPVPDIMVQAPVIAPASPPQVERPVEEEEPRPVSRAHSIISRPSLADIREEVEQEISIAAAAARQEPTMITISPEPLDDDNVSPPSTAPARNLADETAEDGETWVAKYKPDSPAAPAAAVEDEAIPAPPPPAAPLKEFGPSDKNADNMSTKEKTNMGKRMSRAFSFKGRSHSSNDVDRPGTAASNAVSMRGSIDHDRKSIAESTASKRPGIMGRSQTVGAGMMNAMTFGLKGKKDKEKAAAAAAAAEGSGDGSTSRPMSIRSVKHDDPAAPPKKSTRDLMKLAIGKKKEEAAAAAGAEGASPVVKKSSMSNAVNLMMLKKKTQDQKIAAAIAAAAANAPPTTASSVVPDSTTTSPPASSPAADVSAPPTPTAEPAASPAAEEPAKPKRRNTMTMNNAVNLMMLRKKVQEENKDKEAAAAGSAPGTPSAESSSAIDTSATDDAAAPPATPIKRRNTMTMNNAVNLMMFKKGLKDKEKGGAEADSPQPPATASSEVTTDGAAPKKDKSKMMGMGGMFGRKKSSGTPTSTAPATPLPSAIPVPVASSRPPTSSSALPPSHPQAPQPNPFSAATSPFPPANANGSTPPGSSPALEQVATNTDDSATDDAAHNGSSNGDATAAPATPTARPKPPVNRRWSTAFSSATLSSSAKSKLAQVEGNGNGDVHASPPERPATLTRPATASSMFGLTGKHGNGSSVAVTSTAGESGGLGGNAPLSPEPEVKKKSKMSMGSATKGLMAFGKKKK